MNTNWDPWGPEDSYTCSLAWWICLRVIKWRLIDSIWILFPILNHQLTEIKSSAIATAPTLSSQKTQRAHHNISELFIQTSRFFPSSVGAANEDTDSQSYAGEWLSRVLIKGSASRGAINQTQDHSYSHSTDHGCYVVFIQLLARCL